MANKSRRKGHHKEAKDGEVQRLRNIIRRLESDKRKLLSEIKTLEAAFSNNIKFLKKSTEDMSVEELVQAAKKDMTLEEAKVAQEQTMDDLIKKWKCRKCLDGVMKLVIFNYGGVDRYIRCCNHYPKCTNKTTPQPYTDKIKGIR